MGWPGRRIVDHRKCRRDSGPIGFVGLVSPHLGRLLVDTMREDFCPLRLYLVRVFWQLQTLHLANSPLRMVLRRFCLSVC